MVGNLEYLELPEGELPLREGTLDLAGLCRELGEQVSPLTALAGIRFSYEEEIGSLLTHGDGAQLRRLLLNLSANAVRAAGEGGGVCRRQAPAPTVAGLRIFLSGLQLRKSR